MNIPDSSSPDRQVAIVVDAMGGDNAPAAIIAGALQAARALPTAQIILVGDTSAMQAALGPQALPANVTLQHASQVVEMCDAPGTAIRQKRDSSIAVGMRLVRDGKAQAIISAGNSGAMMAGATLIIKLQPTIDRPAIATFLPTRTGRMILLDAGATTDCKPAHLVQFARLGSLYAAAVLDCPSPRIGLLSIGEEPSKGDELTKETHQLLLATSLNFVGNVEPKEMVQGEADVVVCDGFVGNLMLKAGEGFGSLVMELIKEQITSTWWYRLAALMLKPAFKQVKKIFDYAEYGGALLLGVNGIVVIGHGRSNARAIENAIRVAVRAAERHVLDGLPATDMSSSLPSVSA
jgi:glycerol-3-phosphate acyltransferase PlsX